MKLLLKRISLQPTYTIGRLYLIKDGKEVYLCDTIEDVVRDLKTEKDKVFGKTAIPKGTYKMRYTFSNRFKRFLPEIIDVPFFKGIRIHSGNTEVDSEGCILVGQNKKKGMVLNSRDTMNNIISPLFKEYLNEAHSIEIIE